MKGFGIFESGGLGNASLSILSCLQLLVICIYLKELIPQKLSFNLKLNFNLSTNLDRCNFGMLFLFIIGLLKSLTDVISGATTPSTVIGNISTVHIYLLIFVIIKWYDNSRDIYNLADIIVSLAIICSMIELTFVLFGIETGTLKIVQGDLAYNSFRLLTPTGTFIAMGFYLKLSSTIGFFKFRKIDLLSLSILFLGVIIQMHRSVIISFIFSLLFCLFLMFKVKLNSGKRSWGLLLILFLLLIGLYSLFRNSPVLLSVFHSAVKELSSGSGTFGFRLIVLINTFEYILQNHNYFGVGFSWITTEFIDYWNNLFSSCPTNDNSITNVLLVFGFAGLFVYTVLFISIFRSLLKLIKTDDKSIRYISFGLLSAHMYLILTLFSTDNLMGYPHTITFLVVWGLTYNLNRLSKEHI